MKILVTGAGGFLGQVVVERALAAGHEVRAMQRRPPESLSPQPAALEIHLADLTEFERLAAAVAGMEAVVHCAAVTPAGATDEQRSLLVNIEGTRSLYDAARVAGVRRWVQISSMSAHPGSTSVYGRTKLAADGILRADNVGHPAWTILRPSLIYGAGEKGLVAKTLKLLGKLPVLPILGSGHELIRPIYVDDVADAALRCLENERTFYKTYMLGGADEVMLLEFMRRLVAARGWKRPALRLPLPLCHLLALVLARLTPNPPISVDNVLGVREAQLVLNQEAIEDFGFAPLGLEEGLRRTFAALPN